MSEDPIKSNINRIERKLGTEVTLIAVSKTKPSSAIQTAYDAGHRDFGENKVQELSQKAEELPSDIRWHMIGHLQRNKVKYIAPFVYLIHAVDSDKLLREINKQAKKSERVIKCLLQVHIAKEDTKFGWDDDELLEYLSGGQMEEYENIHISGLMGMATYTDDEEIINSEFASIKSLFETIKMQISNPRVSMDILSIGMSNDYEIAVRNGGNMIRIGTAIFGERNTIQ